MSYFANVREIARAAFEAAQEVQRKSEQDNAANQHILKDVMEDILRELQTKDRHAKAVEQKANETDKVSEAELVYSKARSEVLRAFDQLNKVHDRTQLAEGKYKFLLATQKRDLDKVVEEVNGLLDEAKITLASARAKALDQALKAVERAFTGRIQTAKAKLAKAKVSELRTGLWAGHLVWDMTKAKARYMQETRAQVSGFGQSMPKHLLGQEVAKAVSK